MRTLGWITDPHLPRASAAARREFLAAVAGHPVDGWIVTGDVGHAGSLEEDLLALAEAAGGRPVWFVLGNHDFYGGSVEAVRAQVERLTAGHPTLRWLPAAGVVRLDAATVLLGHDGWADARLGDWRTTPLSLNDFRLIAGFGEERGARVARMRELADAAAGYVVKLLYELVGEPARLGGAPLPERVIVATHVPPFPAAATLQKGPAPPPFLPYFASRIMGDVLLAAAGQAPEVEFLVLCGHTHGAGDVRVRPNLRVVTGEAEYGAPVVQPLVVPVGSAPRG